MRRLIYFSTSQKKVEKLARAFGPGHFTARVKYGWGVFLGKI